MLRDCKKCCCILSLFVSHLVVCGCNHSEANQFPCKKYSGQNDETMYSRYNKDVLKLEFNIGSNKQSGKTLYMKLKAIFLNLSVLYCTI